MTLPLHAHSTHSVETSTFEDAWGTDDELVQELVEQIRKAQAGTLALRAITEAYNATH